MPEGFTRNEPYIRIRFIGNDLRFPVFADVQNFLYDLNFLYEVTRLAIDPHYAEFDFSPAVYFRLGRPLLLEHRLHAERLSLQSPIQIDLVINVNIGKVLEAATIYSVLAYSEQILGLINSPLKRRKLKAEVEKLERENKEAAARRETQRFGGEANRLDEAKPYQDVAVRRLERSVIRIEEADIEFVRERGESSR
jgi:hypothetical protein